MMPLTAAKQPNDRIRREKNASIIPQTKPHALRSISYAPSPRGPS